MLVGWRGLQGVAFCTFAAERRLAGAESTSCTLGSVAGCEWQQEGWGRVSTAAVEKELVGWEL